MAASKNDVTRLIEFSLQYHLETAIAAFPMFSKVQIRSIYAMTKGDRRRLLAERVSGEAPHSIMHPIRQHRNAAQAEKMLEQATDPSNR
jgi:hypothetical protein